MTDRYRVDGEKISLHPARVAQWLAAGDDWEKQKKVYPIYVEVSPAGGCNHACLHCGVDYIGYQTRFIELPVMARMLSGMGRAGVKSVMFAGEGEPLLHKGLADAILHAEGAGIDVAITTNAIPLTERFARHAMSAVTWVKASINAGTAETYAKVHQTKERDFDLALTNMARAVRLRGELGWETTLGAQMVVLPENAHEPAMLAARCREIGLDYLVLKPYSQHLKSTETATRGLERFRWTPGAFDDVAREFDTDSFKVITRYETAAHYEEPDRYYQKCLATPNFWAYVMANGDVYGCSAYLLDERFKYGNVNENTFSEIWEGERRRASAAYVREQLDIGECRKNCRMEQVNRHLWDLKNPPPHANFI